MAGWTASDIPDQSGRTRRGHRRQQRDRLRDRARAGPPRRPGGPRLPQRGARDARRVERLLTEVPGAEAEFGRLDLGDLASVRAFAAA